MWSTLYHLVMTGLYLVTIDEKTMKQCIDKWGARNGVKSVSSGVVRCDVSPYTDHTIYSAHFDSSHWTGIGFKGFDVKNPGEPVTEIP